MKKIILLLIIISLNANSQIKFGIKGGLNLADASAGINIKGKANFENITINNGGGTINSSESSLSTLNQTFYFATSPKISFYIGGFADINLNTKGNLQLRSELLFCRNGTSIDKRDQPQDNEDFFNYSARGGYITLNELTIPILLKFTTKQKISFLAGVNLAAVLTANFVESNGLEMDAKSIIKPLDLGLNIGASYDINQNWTVEIRHNRGLFNKSKTKDSDQYFEIQSLLYNRTFHIGLEYKF